MCISAEDSSSHTFNINIDIFGFTLTLLLHVFVPLFKLLYVPHMSSFTLTKNFCNIVYFIAIIFFPYTVRRISRMDIKETPSPWTVREPTGPKNDSKASLESQWVLWRGYNRAVADTQEKPYKSRHPDCC